MERTHQGDPGGFATDGPDFCLLVQPPFSPIGTVRENKRSMSAGTLDCQH